MEQRAKGREMINQSPYEDIMDRFPGPPEPDDFADGGIASFANGGKTVKRRVEKKGGKLGPTDPLSKYESYSEEELAGNIEAKTPTFDTLEDYISETMPMFEPRDVAPPRSYSDMPNIYDTPRLSQVDLADGGIANFRGGGIIKPGKVISKIGGPTQQEIDAFVNQPIPIGQMIPVNEFLPGEDYQTYVRRKRAETGPALFAGEPVTMPVLPSTPTSQVDVNANPIARSLEMAGFTREEIMRIISERGYADGGLTKTVPPVMGPDSQGVETLFRRRYS